MARSIIIKLAIVLIISALGYCAFWFFKIGQVEKQVNKFISDNSQYISGEVSVSGFPASQKITIKNLKISLPVLALDNNEIIIPHLEAKSGILGTEYLVSMIEPATIQDIDGNPLAVEFASVPEIKFTIDGGNIKSFSYKDSGYKILNADKTVAYSSSSNSVLINSVFEIEKTSHKVVAQISESEGFSVVDFYKNSLEKKIIDGIKTGEVTINSAVVETHSAVDANQANSSAAQALQVNQAAVPNQVAPSATNANLATAENNPANAAPQALVAENAASANQGVVGNGSAVTPGNPQIVPDASQQGATTNSELKNTVNISFEYILTPIKQEGQASAIPDPTQIQQAPSHNNKMLKIENIEISNSMFKISVNGEMTSLPDDNLPSGGVTVKIEKMTNLTASFAKDLAQIANKLKSGAQLQINATQSPEAATSAENNAAPTNAADTTHVVANQNSSPVEDPYQVFLGKVAANLEAVSKEIAAKNAATKDDVALFDIRREKNLDFLINETPTREILGKF